MLPPLPRCSSRAYSSLISPHHVSLPRKGHRVGLHIVLFEACSAFTRVAACTLARSPIRDRYSKAPAISLPPQSYLALAEADRRSVREMAIPVMPSELKSAPTNLGTV